MNDDVWILIPAYNESKVIGRVIEELRRNYSNVVVVDDGSSDGTDDVARSAGARVVRHSVNLGQGAALQTGIDYALRACAKFIVTFDADGQHNPGNIEKMLLVLKKENLDVVLGSRFLGEVRNMPRLKRFVLKAAVLFTNISSGLRLTDTHNGLRVMTADAASKFRIEQNGMAHASEILNQLSALNLNYREVPCQIVYTDYSKAKGQRLSNSFRILGDLFMGWLSK